MEEQIPKQFREIFRHLVIALQPRGLERDAVAVYFDVLGDFALEDLAVSAMELAQTKTFFPTTGEWFQVADRVERRRAADEAQAVIDAIRRRA